MESQKDGQVQEIIYSEQKEEHKMNQRVLETTLVKPRKEVEDKICFGFQCKYRNWLKVKVKLLQNIHANANANTIIKDVPNDNNLAMSGGDKLFIDFLKSTYAKPLYLKDKITDPINIQSVLHSLQSCPNISVPFQSSVLLVEKIIVRILHT
ncbi:hypothetical protein RFI_34974 [Reticulomyxa filosa]|uniref:Uncharacterized protein n=1 Tax=Reticulomyxa filosa TaxID=46433 RepID=X6LMU4_RETFI|nr:hypothetical protein RFI_34974 [Reticulomyxa filosa]|eukprot:ETO02457.1 hypothetical protein RFI_34974 [Reticulomyxa filosa]